MLYFATRDKAKAFATMSGHRFVDLGAGATKRWAVQLLVAAAA